MGAEPRYKNQYLGSVQSEIPSGLVSEVPAEGAGFSVEGGVNRFKGRSSRMLRQEFASLRSRLPTLWNRSYYAGSVGAVSEAVVRRYIEAQKGV